MVKTTQFRAPWRLLWTGAVGLLVWTAGHVMEPACSYSPCVTPNVTLSKCSKSGCPHYAHHVCFLSSYPLWEENTRYCAGCAPSHAASAKGRR